MNMEQFKELQQFYKKDLFDFAQGDGLSYELYEKLFDIYTESGEMPYSVAKARTDDPYTWIDDRFTAFIEKNYLQDECTVEI
jgi:hypothetical protein